MHFQFSLPSFDELFVSADEILKQLWRDVDEMARLLKVASLFIFTVVVNFNLTLDDFIKVLNMNLSFLFRDGLILSSGHNRLLLTCLCEVLLCHELESETIPVPKVYDC